MTSAPSTPPGAPGTELAAADRATLIHPTLAAHRTDRTVLVSGSGSRVRDARGREYLDASAALSVIQVGHGRQELAQAAAEQMTRLGYFHTWGTVSNDRAVELAARLVRLSPEPLCRVYFTSGGAEGNEIALRMARLYHHRRGEPQRTWILSRQTAYHGIGYGSGGVSGFPVYHEGFGPSLPDVHFLTPPHPYRRELFAGADVTDFCLAELRETIERIGPERIAAMIGEPAMAVAGAVVPPADYWPRVADLLRSYGVLLISDEVITAYGRTGHWFAAEHFGVVPDIMVTAKGITSGYVPHGAVLTTEEVAAEVTGDHGFPIGYTYTGHPTACAVALANLDIIDREGLVANATAIGDYLGSRLAELAGLPVVGEVRQLGLMLAVELVTDQQSRRLLTGGTVALADALQEQAGILLRTTPYALLINPPLVFTREDADELVDGLRSVLSRTGPDGQVH
ncbi:aspartate aminotransferase family protein [Streptomyces sp. NA02950]|uniref:aminotransferase family protein n=1 Tax=Streptomyces sp. NA02950 TaxID=2742137 RepID=UPI0015906233|nr:aspartate aminotransferase family protein [Streptomyces sp. NA02950]QKV97098.1 aspartate aminotransferase family protein [Streptomyces sp. NA02950]